MIRCLNCGDEDCNGRCVEPLERRCIFSPDRSHRYTLWRDADIFGNKGFVQFIGLNPSKADEIRDDNTVTRCIDFATRWGFKELCMTNLFAFRATLPEDMKAAVDPVGPENLKWLKRVALQADLIVAAWGVDGVFKAQARTFLKEVMEWGEIKIHCLGLTQGGQPKHPLYLAAITEPQPFNFLPN